MTQYLRQTVRPLESALPPGHYRRASLVVVDPDTGCVESPSCLRCPLPQCVHDLHPGLAARNEESSARLDRVIELRKEGKTAVQIAAQIHLGERTVWKYLSLARQEVRVAKGKCPSCKRKVNTDPKGKIGMHAAPGLKSRRERTEAGPCPGVGKNPSKAKVK